MELWQGIFTSIVAFALGGFLLARTRRHARSFAAVSLLAGLYVLALTLLFATRDLAFSPLSIASGAGLLGAAFFFALGYFRGWRYGELAWLLPLLAVALLAPTDLLVSGSWTDAAGVFRPRHGALAPALPPLVGAYAVSIWVLIARARARVAGRERVQAGVVLAAFTILLSSILLFNVLAPVLGYAALNAVTAFSLLLFLALVTYALTVQGLLDVRLSVFRAFRHGIIPLSAVAGSIASATGLALLSPHASPTAQAVLMVASSGACALVAQLALTVRMRSDEIAELRAGERRLVADIAHGLQTPLAVLRAEMDGAPDIAPLVRTRVIRAVDDLSSRVRSLITYARAGMPLTTEQRMPVSLDRLVREVAEYVGTVAHSKDVSLRVGRIDQAIIPGRKADLESLLTNLLSNAVRHACSGPAPHEVFISLASSLDGIRLTIGDTGSGMSDDDRERAFQPLYRGSGTRAGSGMGLGLAIAKQVAEAHGGAIEIGPRPEGGTLVTATFGKPRGELLH